MFNTALIWPDMACCWPMVEARPFWALDTDRNDAVSRTIAVSSVA